MDIINILDLGLNMEVPEAWQKKAEEDDRRESFFYNDPRIIISDYIKIKEGIKNRYTYTIFRKGKGACRKKSIGRKKQQGICGVAKMIKSNPNK